MKYGALALGTLCLAILFFLRVDLFLRSERAHTLEPTSQKVEVVGRVVEDPENREFSLHATVEVEKIGGVPASGKALVILPRGLDVSYNDHVVVEGKLEKPKSFETDTGRIFDYEGYLRVRGVSALMRYAELKAHEKSGPTFFGTLYSIKHTFERSLERILSEPQASLLEGILLGERRALPEALTAAFIVASLIHIVVLSGYNISIVGDSVLRALQFLSPRGRFAVGAVFMILFVLMTGASSTSIRACIMALIAILGRYLHRPAAALRALLAAAVLMVFWNPLIVLYDTGFILSITATFGLIMFGEALEQKLPWLPAWKYLNVRAIAASTLSVQFFLLPALLYFSGVLSFVSLPANLLVLPVVPATMLLGFLSGALGIVGEVFEFLPAFLTDILLRYIIWVTEVSASLPFSSTVIPAFPLWVAVLAYVPLTLFATFVYVRTSAREQTN